MSEKMIPTWVRGNAREIALPLEVVIDTPQGRRRENYIPQGEVKVYLVGYRRYAFVPAIAGNVLHFTVGGDVAVGVYGVEVVEKGVPLRSFKRIQVCVVESNDELPAGAVGEAEFEQGGVTLDAGVYFYAEADPIVDVDYVMNARTMCLELSKGSDKPSPEPEPSPLAAKVMNPTTWKRVHHCIRYNSKPGFVYVGKKMSYNMDFPKGCMMMPCMIFPKGPQRTFDLSKLGTEWFNLAGSYDGHDQVYDYEIDVEKQTITFFEEDTPNGKVARLRFPDRPNYDHWVETKMSSRSFGYFIDKDGRLQCTLKVAEDGKITKYFSEPLIDPPLEPIHSAGEFLDKIMIVRPPLDYKDVLDINENIPLRPEYEQRGWAIGYNGRAAIELEVLKHDQYRKTEQKQIQITKWVKVRSSYQLNNFDKGYNKRLFGWDLVSLHGTPRVIKVRVRRTNRLHTRFSEWTYWKLFANVKDIPKSFEIKRAIRYENSVKA